MNLCIKQRHLAAIRKYGFSSLDAGYVTWMATPPNGIRFALHVFSFIDAIETAAHFIYGFELRPANAVVVGHEALRFVSMLPQFQPRHDISTIDGCEFVGQLCNLDVFWTHSRLRENEAIVLGPTSQCRITIIHSHYHATLHHDPSGV